MKLLVTGAAGSSAPPTCASPRSEHEVRVLDKLTYAGRRENLPEGRRARRRRDRGPAVVREAMEGCDAVVNFAAESHVDRSIDDQDAFARTHVIGTGMLLDAARELGVGRYLQVSTDEVYGSIESGSFTETSPLDPSSPYSATKAAGDLLVSAHVHTYGIEAVICRGSNNYGPRQYPEKLIPLMVLNALHGDSLPVYGDGRQVRNWLYVEDFCRGIHRVLIDGRPGEAYNVGGPDECENIDVVKRVIELTGADESLIEYVTDRPGHDRRYSLASEKIRAELGWEAQVHFDEGLERTVEWYRDNEEWWEPIRSGEYREYYEKQYGRPWLALGEAAPGDRRARHRDRKLAEDRQVDEEVGERVPARVELAVEAPHRAVEGDVVPQAAVALLFRRPALDVEAGDAAVVHDPPARLLEAVAPVEVVHVEPVALVEQADLVHRALADQHVGAVDRVDVAELVLAELGRLVLAEPRRRAGRRPRRSGRASRAASGRSVSRRGRGCRRAARAGSSTCRSWGRPPSAPIMWSSEPG